MGTDRYIDKELVMVQHHDGRTEYFAVDDDTADNMFNTHSALTLGPGKVDYDIVAMGIVKVQEKPITFTFGDPMPEHSQIVGDGIIFPAHTGIALDLPMGT